MVWLGPLGEVNFGYSSDDVTMLPEEWRRVQHRQSWERRQNWQLEAWNREMDLMKRSLASTTLMPPAVYLIDEDRSRGHNDAQHVISQMGTPLVTGGPVIENVTTEPAPKPVPKSPLPWDGNKYLTDDDRTWLQRMWEPTKNLPPGPWVTTELIR